MKTLLGALLLVWNVSAGSHSEKQSSRRLNLFGNNNGVTLDQAAYIGQDYHTTITRHVGIPIPQPYAVPVERFVAVPAKTEYLPSQSAKGYQFQLSAPLWLRVVNFVRLRRQNKSQSQLLNSIETTPAQSRWSLKRLLPWRNRQK